MPIQNILETSYCFLSLRRDTVRNQGISKTKKFYDCCFMTHGYHKIVKSHGVFSLTLVKIAANDVVASILMR